MFPITGTTTFQYTAGTFAPFSGTIEHAGTVSFNANTLTIGNFTIGFDAARAGATTSGFFVADNVRSRAWRCSTSAFPPAFWQPPPN